MSRLFTFLFSALLVPVLLSAQAQTSECVLKALYIDKITRYIEWPCAAAVPSSKKTVLGFIGADRKKTEMIELFISTPELARKYRVLETASFDQMQSCHILFIFASEKKRLETILRHISRMPVLTIADEESFCSKGTHIGFGTGESTIGLSINPAALEKAGLFVSYHLLRLARIIENPGETE